MSVVYMPSERCPSCPFNTLCSEEMQCPILQEAPVKTLDIREELRQFAGMNYLKTVEQVESSIEAFRGD